MDLSQNSAATRPSSWLETVPGKIALILAVVGLDQATKLYALREIRGTLPRSYLGDLFRIEYAENSGAFLGLGATLSAETRFWIFVIAVGAFVGYVLYTLFWDRRLDRLSLFSWAMIAAGGIGNLIDRSTRENHGVIDFMNMGIGGLRTGIFNVADMAIMLGVILLAVQAIQQMREKPPGESTPVDVP